MPFLKRPSTSGGYLLAAFSVASATAVFYLGRDIFAKGQWALLYLLIIGFVASLAGFRAALLASFLSFFAWNYFFLPPYHTFVLDDPKDILSLFVFLAVGVLIGLQTARLKEREETALYREQETAMLNRFSAHLVSDISLDDVGKILIDEVIRVTSARCATIFLPDAQNQLQPIAADAPGSCAVDESMRRTASWVAGHGKAAGLPAALQAGEGSPSSAGQMFFPIVVRTGPRGVLVIGERTNGLPYGIQDTYWLTAIANLVGAYLERQNLQAVAVAADALREADHLKSTLISSVSHDLKTPLASVTATVTNLLEGDTPWSRENVTGELKAVQEDLERLNTSIESLIDLSRLESAAWKPSKEWYDVGEILGGAAAKLPQKERGRVSFDLPEELPMIHVDFPQLARALQHILENALSYSPAGSPVRVGAAASSGMIRLWVEDSGPGIPAEEHEPVFEKFYRGRHGTSAPSGTGLGLAIAREIVRRHGGRIWIEDVLPHGARVMIALPEEKRPS